MMGVPQVESVSHKDVLDAILTSVQRYEDKKDANGKILQEIGINYKSLWYKLHSVNSPTFGRFAFELEELYSKAEQCKNNMCPERAAVMAGQILQKVESYRYSIDAKSSESRMNKDNRQQTLIDKLASQKTERVVSVKEDTKKGIWESITGKEKQQATE